MNTLGKISGILCVLLSLFYDWQLTIILLLFFVTIKTDMVNFVEQLIYPKQNDN